MDLNLYIFMEVYIYEVYGSRNIDKHITLQKLIAVVELSNK
jgi:hypothetical protein